MTVDQFIALNDEIAALVRSGVPLERGLSELGKEMPGRLGEIAVRLAERSAAGEPLDQCITDEIADTSPAYQAVVQAGLRAGRLPAALEAVASSSRRVTDTYRAAVVAVSYPMLIFAFAWAGAALFTSLLAPQLAASFRSMDLPGQRFFDALCWIGRGAWFWGPVGPLAAVAIIATWWSVCRCGTLFSGPWSNRLLTGLPWMGSMLRWSRTATFLEVLSLLIDSEVPLPDAVQLAAQSSGDPQTLQAGRQLAATLEAGHQAAPEGRDCRLDEKGTVPLGARPGPSLPPLLGWLMGSAGRPGTLLPAIRHAAATYHRRARYQAKMVQTFLPVLLTVILGGGITAAYVLTLFVPYTSMLRALAR
ncbi:MAG: type II secretion system F family protein [Planctomycetaceae bacterium]|nr:type II secretion system F family protein [Planctomycetaceae bacterium]